MDNMSIAEMVQVVYNINELNYQKEIETGFEMDIERLIKEVDSLEGVSLSKLYIGNDFVGYVDTYGDIHRWLESQLYFELENYENCLTDGISFFFKLEDDQIDSEEYINIDLGYGIPRDELQIINL